MLSLEVAAASGSFLIIIIMQRKINLLPWPVHNTVYINDIHKQLSNKAVVAAAAIVPLVCSIS
jgi:hypothetical protein